MSRRPTQDFTVFVDELGTEATATVAMISPGDPGRLSGPPEHCYPPEPAEFEIINWSLDSATLASGVSLGCLDNEATDAVLELAADADWSDEPDADYLRDLQQDRDMNGWGE